MFHNFEKKTEWLKNFLEMQKTEKGKEFLKDLSLEMIPLVMILIYTLSQGGLLTW